MKISKHVTEMLDTAGPFIDRLATIVVARDMGVITEKEFEDLRALTLWEWRGAG